MISSLSSHAPFLWLVTASLIAGVMNAMAGGGSFISFPAMLAIGVPPIQANATNTVAIWPGQLTSVWALRGDLRRDLLAVIAAASILGGVCGAVVLLHTRQVTFLRIIPWLLLVASLIFGISGPVMRWLRERSAQPHVPRSPAMLPLFFILFPVCFYIGYFGAGAGFLIMTALALFGVEEMNALNSMKVTAACLSNLSAVLTFIVSGAVVWRYCFVSMVFAGVGGYVGAQYARKMNPAALRAIVVVTGCAVAAVVLLEGAMSTETAMSALRTTPIELLGFIAAFCTTAAFVPQLVRVVRLRSAREISLGTFLLFSIGVFLWLLYGLYIGSKPVIASNTLTLVLSISILVLKLRYDRHALDKLKAEDLKP